MQTPFRPEPKMPAHAYTTYALVRPAATHYRPATCREVECANYEAGWVTRCDTRTDLGKRQADYITNQSGRHYTARLEMGDSPIVVFTFPAGQACFTAHRLPLHREPVYLRRNGDHRGNPRGEKLIHANAVDWRDDMAQHLDQLSTERAKG